MRIDYFQAMDFRELSNSIPTGDYNQQVCLLISSNPQVQNLELCSPYLSPSRTLWNTLSRLQNPRRLLFWNVNTLPKSTLDFFWQACSLFEELNLRICDTSHHDTLRTLPFPFLKRLTLYIEESNDSTDADLNEFLDWLIALPQLEALDLQGYYRGYPLSDNFISALSEKRWPRLESFRMMNVSQSSVVWASIIQSLPPLKEFWSNSCPFKDQGFARLQENHFKTLRNLNVRGCTSFSSCMALSVLTGCVLLDEFRAPYLCAADLKSGASTSQDWACVGLKYLKIHIVRESCDPESSEIVFRQLSRLNQLRQLHFDQWLFPTLPAELKTVLIKKGALQLRLDVGLGHLSKLKRLVNISFGTQQSMQVEEVEWILENWTSLEGIVGPLLMIKILRLNWVGCFVRVEYSM